MRIEICYEDAIQYQWFLVKDSIQFPDEVPLTLGHTLQELPIGKVTDIRREDDGAITGELFFHEPSNPREAELAAERKAHLLEGFDKGWYDGSMYATDVADERCDDLRIVHRATLRYVAIVPVPKFPLTRTS